MTCYSPLKGFAVGLTPAGKPDYKITTYDTHHVEINLNGTVSVAPTSIRSPYAKKVVTDYVEIPCGRCIGCRLEYSRQWADRCLLEMKDHESSYFVTLTYDDAHMPVRSWIDTETGECGNIATLLKRDFQLFMKRLRKAYPYHNPLRYFAAGEYGNTTMRPHYHAIIFGLKLDDLKYYKKYNGFDYYNSPFLDKVWQNRGFVVVAKACWETCAYTARYIMKKQKGSGASVYEKYNFEPEFSLMSRKPGLGRKYFDKNIDKIFDSDFISVATPDGSKQIRPNRYFLNLLQAFDEEKFLEIKESRQEFAAHREKLKLDNTSNSYLDMLAVAESTKKASIKALKRKEV